MRKKYSELALGLILIDVLMAEEQGITVEELVARDKAAYERSKQATPAANNGAGMSQNVVD